MSRRRKRFLFLSGLVILIAAALVLHPIRVISGSMRPSLDEGEFFLATRGFVGEIDRHDLVLVEEPDLENLVIKRIAGLPGEKVQVIGEDLFADGERVVREIDSITDLVPLMSLEGADASTQFNLEGSGLELENDRWHLASGTEAHASVKAPPLDGFLLRGQFMRGHKPAEDLGIEIDFWLESEDAWVGAEIQEQGDRFYLVLDRGGTHVTVNREGNHRVILSEIELPRPVREGTLFLANVDQQLLATLNDEVLFREPYGIASARPIADLPDDLHFSRVAILGKGPLLVGRIRVGRDIVRIPAGTHGCAEALHLGRDEYFVLGDNPHVSRDSRQFGAVPRERIRGRLLGRLWPPGAVGMGWDD